MNNVLFFMEEIMKKFELCMLVLFLIISMLFHFVVPNTSIASIDEEIFCIIYVEGLVVQELMFDYIPTVKNVLDMIGIENTFEFNDHKTLVHRQVFYIPETSENKVSLNHASFDTLMSVNGIGEVIANKIIAYRIQNPFMIIEDIQNISGIGYKTYLNLREYVCL